MRNVTCTFNLDFTTRDYDKLPTGHKIKLDLEDLFANQVEEYLHKLGVSSEEVHLILGEEIYVVEAY